MVGQSQRNCPLYSCPLNRLPSAKNISYRRPQQRYQPRQDFVYQNQNYVQPDQIKPNYFV